MLLLAIDTSTPSVTVALHDGDRVTAERAVVSARRHTEELMPQITAALAAAGSALSELTDVAVGVGPGPFTGLRVGLATARTLGEVLGVPVHGVCSLDIIAYQAAPQGGDFLVATDARRREVYWARYGADGTRDTAPDIGPAAEIPVKLPAAGAGPALYPDAFAGAIVPEYPSAASLAEAVAAKAVEIVPPEPMYLRHADAKPPGARKSVLP